VAPAAGSAARSAEGQAATNRLALLALLHSAAKARPRSAPRVAAVAMATGVCQSVLWAYRRWQRQGFAGLAPRRQANDWPPGLASAERLLPHWFIKVSISSGTLLIFVSPTELMPNPSFKPSPNSVSRRPSSAGPAAHSALAVRRATLSVPA